MIDSAAIDISRIGAEENGVVRVTDVFPNPEAEIEIAAAAPFARINPHYPGVRAAVDDRILAMFRAALSTFAGEAFGLQPEAWEGAAWYSIVTTPPGELAPIQRLPHYDGVQPDLVAVLLYLQRTEHGGTNFFRHKDTGFETITAERFHSYRDSLEKGVRHVGLPPPGYMDDGAPLFERIAAVEPAFNTMVFYRGCSLHSGSIRNDAPLSADPRQGRLTINGFFRPARTG